MAKTPRRWWAPTPCSSAPSKFHLHFAELEYGPGNPSSAGESERVFNILINGAQLFTDFDVLSTSGAPNEPVEIVLRDVSPNEDGVVRIQTTRGSGEPMLAGVELFRGAPGKILPIRILCGRSSDLHDDDGVLWSADQYFRGGRSVPRSNQILATDSPNLYAAERDGNFRYRIPVAAGGTYSVKLHCAEQWWGAANPGGGGAGSGIFDVHGNGIAVLKDFDVYQLTGGENRAIVRTLAGLKPNPRGLLDLSFIPTANYAVINAIEVVSE